MKEVRRLRIHLTALLDRPPTTAGDGEGKKREPAPLADLNSMAASIKKVRDAVETLDKMGDQLSKYLGSPTLPLHNLVPALDIPVDNGDGMRRVDWLVGRNEACRWVRRTNFRTEAIQNSLTNCGRFMR